VASNQTVFVSLASSVSGLQFEPIVFGDEYDNVILFAQNSLTKEGTAVVIDINYFSQSTINTFAPFTLILNPTQLETESKIYKIEYDFGNGNVHVQNFYYGLTSENSYTLTFSADPGDVRNYNAQETFYLETPESRLFVVEIRIFQIGAAEYERYYVNLFLDPPSLDGEINNYFKDLHLITTRMFDFDDKVYYNFESQSPNFILPAVVKWERNIASQTTIEMIEDRPYKLLQPFEKENVTSIETKFPISFVKPASASSNIIDIGM
jgi:hypothetical protein